MAFGFSPKHIQEVSLDNLTADHFFILAMEAVKKLGWNIGYISEHGFIAYTKFSMGYGSQEIAVNIENESATIKSESTGRELVDWGRNKKNVEDLIGEVCELQTVLTSDDIALKLEELKPQIVSKGQDILNQPPSTTKEKITGFFSILKPTEGYYITPILVNINILIFILMAITGVNIISPDSASLLTWGANFRPVTLEGEWWRLLTSCFLHIGILHLLMNMYALVYIGLLLEPYLGRTRFAAAYLLTGITASMASLWWHDMTVSAGASGAIFGMYGVFLAMLTTNLIDKAARQALLSSIAVFVGYNLLNGLRGGIDNAAHIGGLVGGLIIGYAYLPSLKKPDARNLALSTVGLLAVIVLTGSSIIYKKLPNDIGTYDTKIKEFTTMETMALEVYSLPEDTPKDKYLYALKDRGIDCWERNIQLIDELDKLDIPDMIHQRNSMLKNYCELRIKSYELSYRAVSEGTDQYTDQINNYNSQIHAVITDLGGGQQSK